MARQIQGMDPLLRGLEHFRRKAGAVSSLDGRRVATRSKHSALNTLLQSAGAVVMRWQFVLLRERCEEMGIKWGEDVRPLLHVHDEVQAALRPGLEEEYARAFTLAFEDTESALGVRIPLRCDVQFGESWLETH
jgi:DNA polymerase I-like protein with 3'-5' exonuclease and polymerase domains